MAESAPSESSICKMSRVTPENPGEVPMVLPDLQGWAAAHILARTQPADTQPAQPGSAASAGFTALVNAPETHLGFSVLALTLPRRAPLTRVTCMSLLFSSLTRRVKLKLSSKPRWRKPPRVRGAASGSQLALPEITNTSVRSRSCFCRRSAP